MPPDLKVGVKIKKKSGIVNGIRFICDLSLDVFKFDPYGGFHFMSFDIVLILMMDCFIAFTIMYRYCTISFFLYL